MQNDNIEKQKQRLLDEISEDREKLIEINERINEVGSSIPFWKFFLIPAVTSILIVVIARQFGIRGNQAVGLLVVSLIILITLATILGKRNISHKKENLIIERMTIQQGLVAKSRRLKELLEKS